MNKSCMKYLMDIGSSCLDGIDSPEFCDNVTAVRFRLQEAP